MSHIMTSRVFLSATGLLTLLETFAGVPDRQVDSLEGRGLITVADRALPTADFQLPTSNFQLPASNFQLPTSNFQLPTSCFLLQFAEAELESVNCTNKLRMRTARDGTLTRRMSNASATARKETGRDASKEIAHATL